MGLSPATEQTIDGGFEMRGQGRSVEGGGLVFFEETRRMDSTAWGVQWPPPSGAAAGNWGVRPLSQDCGFRRPFAWHAIVCSDVRMIAKESRLD